MNGKRLREQQIGFSEDFKGMWILLTVLWTPSGNQPPSCRGHLAHRSSHMAHGYPTLWFNTRTHTQHTNSYPVSNFLCSLSDNSSESNLWHMASKRSQRASWNLQARERPQIWALMPLLEKQKGSCQHSTWCNTGSREGIYAKEFCHKGEQEAWNSCTKDLRKPQNP